VPACSTQSRAERLPYWLIARPEALNQPAIAAFLEALHARLTEVRPRLLGERA